MTVEEVASRGWQSVDVVFVTGDAYVDHPSFAAGLLCRMLEAAGYRVAVLAQPDWRSAVPWRRFGRPRLAFCISAGNLDSMLNHYTAARKVRNDDAYSPGGRIGLRPDRATAVYCQRAREAFPGVPIIAGGIEASMRRLAHYDYWSDKVRRAIIFDAKADLVVYGMGERPLLEILRRLAGGEPIAALRDIRGTCYRLGASEQPAPARFPACGEPVGPSGGRAVARRTDETAPCDDVELPSYEAVATDKQAFARMTALTARETNPYCARRLLQRHGRETLVVNPPAFPLSIDELDWLHALPSTRRPHPSYGDAAIPAFGVVRDSVQILRGCFGGCAFCSLSAHQGRIVQSRSEASILDELRRIAASSDFRGVVSDLGGPTANMYRMGCRRAALAARCRRTSCLFPAVCPNLVADHGPLVRLLRAARKLSGVRQVLVASGVRMDLALASDEYIDELARHHTGGRLKVAPEHCDPAVLRAMRKPAIESFEAFAGRFKRFSARAGKRQYLVPYFMSGHPGCDLRAMVELAVFLKRSGYRPEKVQEFIPLPGELATCMYHTGLDPLTGRSVYVPRGARERRWQRALLQFWKPQNDADVRRALKQAGRTDLIGDGPDCLVPDIPPRAAVDRRRRRRYGSDETAKQRKDRRAAGYRPHRASRRRRRGRPAGGGDGSRGSCSSRAR